MRTLQDMDAIRNNLRLLVQKMPHGETFEDARLKSKDPEYAKLKNQLQREWRDRIFDRDGRKCRVCNDSTDLELAHVTSTMEFAHAYGIEKGLPLSYTNSNLTTLCSSCHSVQHRHYATGTIADKALRRLQEELKVLACTPAVKAWLSVQERIKAREKLLHGEAIKRHNEVNKLFDSIKKERGWIRPREMTIE